MIKSQNVEVWAVQKLQKCVNFVDPVKSFQIKSLFQQDPYSKEYLDAKIDFDTAENEP